MDFLLSVFFPAIGISFCTIMIAMGIWKLIDRITLPITNTLSELKELNSKLEQTVRAYEELYKKENK